jgi:uncharacterized membrane protein YqiK
MQQKKDDDVNDLKNRYLTEARKFVEALGNDASQKELTSIRKNVKEILKGMLKKKNDQQMSSNR